MTVAVCAPAVPAVVGSRLIVPLVTGGRVAYANLDHAAGAPCLAAVRDAVDELLPWYASVHRGAGFASRVCTGVHEQARDVLRRFTGARRTDAVVFTRNTTDALNLLAHVAPSGTSVVLFDTEHHAALLPWRGGCVQWIATPPRPWDTVAALDEALAACPTGPRLVVLTGASNVTGELWPVTELAATARRHGARVALDAAQLAPHRVVDIGALDVDYVAVSGHKLYAPFGAGALVGRADWLNAAAPYLLGGGATRQVSARGGRLFASWASAPERHEAGSPNVVGVHALAVACDTLTRHHDAVLSHERALLDQLRAGLATVPGLHALSLFGPGHDRVGVVGFVLDGAFCAHVATRRVLAGTGHDRALRASIGLGSTAEHVARLVSALHALVAEGPQWTYELVDGRWAPAADPRSLPSLLTPEVTHPRAQHPYHQARAS